MKKLAAQTQEHYPFTSQFGGAHFLSDPAAAAEVQMALLKAPVERYGPPSAGHWNAVLVRSLK